MKTITQLKNKLFNIKKSYLLLVVLLLLLFVLRSFLLKKPDTTPTYTLSKTTMVDTVEVSGTYITASQTPVFSPTKGIITQLFVQNKDEVKKGDPLFHVESTATKEEIATAYSAYQTAIANYTTAKQAKQNYDAIMWAKQQQLLDVQNKYNEMKTNLSESVDNPVTHEPYTTLEIRTIESNLTRVQKEFSSAEKQYKEAEIAINSGASNIAKTKLVYEATQDITVFAPASGKVVNLLSQVGDGVASSASTLQSSPVMFIANLAEPSIIVQISEAYISRISEGQTATIIFDSAKDKQFAGKVEVVDTIGTNTNGIVTYNARISIKDIIPDIKPGMTATVSIETFKKDDVVSVPNNAIFWKNNQAYIQSYDHGHSYNQLLPVDLGYKGLTQTEITSDLPDNLIIISNKNYINHE